MKSTHYYIQKHPYHILSASPWPILTAFNAMCLALALVLFMHRYMFGLVFFSSAFLSLIYVSYKWSEDMIYESAAGRHTSYVQLGFKIGTILFICSEVMLFFSFFWAYFHSSLNPGIGIGGIWPPLGIEAISPWFLPLLNTFILLTSGATVTWCHHAIVLGDRFEAKQALLATIVLGLIFSSFQLTEYIAASFSISDSVYGSLFYMITGFHGAHVLIGTGLLFLCYIRLCQEPGDYKYSFTKQHHVGFEASAWYWHFVDIVWIVVYLLIYIWGGGFLPDIF